MLKPGDTFERFTIEALIGQGGMGCVYRAYDPRLDRRVALKVISEGFAPAAANARLMREARAAAALDHPNAVAIFDVGELDGAPFIVMELVEGRTLRRAPGDATPHSQHASRSSQTSRALWRRRTRRPDRVDLQRARLAEHNAGMQWWLQSQQRELAPARGDSLALGRGVRDASRNRIAPSTIAQRSAGGVTTRIQDQGLPAAASRDRHADWAHRGFRGAMAAASGPREHVLAFDAPSLLNGADDLEGRIHHELRLVANNGWRVMRSPASCWWRAEGCPFIRRPWAWRIGSRGGRTRWARGFGSRR